MTYKQCFAACAMLMFSFLTTSALANASASGRPNVQLQVEKKWELPAKPLDIVYSLDEKKVFILTQQNLVLVYKASGELLGKIAVSKGVSAIDISPRGDKLYLVNQKDDSFSEISVDFVVNIDTVGSPYLGQFNAPVTIAFFTDFE